MVVEIVYETHALTEDNERGIATGWLPGRLSAQGRANAAEMGRRRRDDGIAAVFCSDLRRAMETAEIAFGESGIPIRYDWRLRETNLGERNGRPSAELGPDRAESVDRPYPGGESRRQAIDRVAGMLRELPSSWDGRRVMLIGHGATQQALEHVVNGVSVEDLNAGPFEWRAEGWEYRMATPDPAREVVAAAERRAEALVSRDAAALTRYMHPQLRWTTFAGTVLDRDAYVAGNTAGDLIWLGQRLEDVDVQVVGDRVAVLTALVVDTVRRDGREQVFRLRLTQTWVREPTGWQCLSGHAAALPDSEVAEVEWVRHTSSPMTVRELSEAMTGLPDDVPVLVSHPDEAGRDAARLIIHGSSARVRPNPYGSGRALAIEGELPSGTYQRARRLTLTVTGLPTGEDEKLIEAVKTATARLNHRGSTSMENLPESGTISWTWTARNVALAELANAARQAIEHANPGHWRLTETPAGDDADKESNG